MLARLIILLNCGNVFCLSYSRSISRLEGSRRAGFVGPSAAWSQSYADARDAAAPDYELGIALTVARRCIATVAGSLLAYPRDDPIYRLRAGSPHPHPRSAPGVPPGRSVGEQHRRDRRGAAARLAPAMAATTKIGGLVTSFISWRASFILQVLIVVAIIWLGRSIADPPLPAQRPVFDWLGAVLSAVGLFFVVFGFLQSGAYGWGTATEGLRDRRHCDHPSGRYLAGIGPAS